ncbi:hydrogenase maturation protease [bacterium]|nr:hydrogenase maturation protease [bacterium]
MIPDDARALLAGLLNDPGVAVIGLGNRDRADDGAGIEIAGRMKSAFSGRIFIEPEQGAESAVLELLDDERFHHVLFIDAVDFKAEPGTIRLFGIGDADDFLPAFSTHQAPVGLLMRLLSERGKKCHLFGIQPGSTEIFGDMTESVRTAILELNEKVIGEIDIEAPRRPLRGIKLSYL